MKPYLLGAAICGLTLLTWFQFPGHTWLQQDSQIYVPILEHLWDPAALRQDILVQRPHVSFTLFDESALALRKVTGLGFREVLSFGQLVTRALGIWGFYLMALAVGLPAAPALLVTGILSLGATIVGPTVLSFEYEPDPRGFAVPLLMLAIGLAAHRRDFGAGLAGAAAFLIHPPTVYPFWGVYFCMALWPAKPDIMRQRLYAFIPLLAAALALLAASRYQPGASEAQAFFTRLTPEIERLQRMRAPYNWISVWWRSLWPHYVFLYALTLAGYWRLRQHATIDLSFFLLGLPLIGMLSMPVSYLLLEKMKWALIPQFQPMRALLFVTVIAIFSAAAAGCHAALKKRYPEAFLWLALAYLVPVNTRAMTWLAPNRIATILILAVAAVLACSLSRRWAVPAIVSAALAGFFVIPTLGGVTNYPRLYSPEVDELAGWARTSTPVDAVFLFPDNGKDLYPGIFRAQSLRAVYVDWKGGGQVNYLKELGEQWWERWQRAMTKPLPVKEYQKLGIDYLVLRAGHDLPGHTPMFQNKRFWVLYSSRSASR